MITWLSAVTAAAACSCSRGTGSSGTPHWTVRDSAGVTIVFNHPQSVSHGCITLASDPETRVGSGVQRGDSASPLSDIRGGAVLRDGRIVVLNAGSRELLFYAPDGHYEYAVGGAGRGPGEFVEPTWLGHANADTLFIWDTRLSRLSSFDATGALLNSRQVGFKGATGPPPAISGRFEDGSFFANPGPLVFFSGSESGVTRLAQTYQRYDPQTDHTSHLADGRSVELVVGAGGVYSLPFGKTELAVPHGDALLVADNGIAAVRFYDMNGNLNRVMTWVSEPIQVTARDESAYRRYLETESSRFSHPANSPFAAERPRFSSIHSDRTGWIWVRSYGAEWDPPPPWLVFDGSGVLQCEVQAPDRVAVLEIGQDYLLGRQTDALGEETVLRFGLHRDTATQDFR